MAWPYTASDLNLFKFFVEIQDEVCFPYDNNTLVLNKQKVKVNDKKYQFSNVGKDAELY